MSRLQSHNAHHRNLLLYKESCFPFSHRLHECCISRPEIRRGLGATSPDHATTTPHRCQGWQFVMFTKVSLLTTSLPFRSVLSYIAHRGTVSLSIIHPNWSKWGIPKRSCYCPQILGLIFRDPCHRDPLLDNASRMPTPTFHTH